MIDKIEKSTNWASDSDWLWWPFLRWRPNKKDIYDNVLVIKLTLYIGVATNVTLALLIIATDKNFDWIPSWVCLASCWPLAFLIQKFICAWAWNRRALRLRNE